MITYILATCLFIHDGCREKGITIREYVEYEECLKDLDNFKRFSVTEEYIITEPCTAEDAIRK